MTARHGGVGDPPSQTVSPQPSFTVTWRPALLTLTQEGGRPPDRHVAKMKIS